ncbi:MAG: HPr family phosphocarrier protein [Clostridia bacterium]|nr:HPr family phosphocarrier protein [Clostridia bacterium]
MVSVKYTIKNEEGLHARPAADFCKTAAQFKSNIQVTKDGESFEAKSMLMVLCIGAVKGDEIELSAEGEDEEEAIAALIETLDSAV